MSPTCPLTKPIPIYNIDGTANDAGMITDIADIILRYENHLERTQLAVTHHGSLILGYYWLCNHKSTGRQRTSKCLVVQCNAQLVELKINVM
jgi:hypothetical protein